MTREIKLGHVYHNKWGDQRVPIYFKEDNVVYIDKKNLEPEQLLFHYNPYMNTTRKVNFLKTFSEFNINNPLTELELEKIKIPLLVADEKWRELLTYVGVEINSILIEK